MDIAKTDLEKNIYSYKDNIEKNYYSDLYLG